MLQTIAPGLILRVLTPNDAGTLHALLRSNRTHLTAHGDYQEQVAATLDMLTAELAEEEGGRWRFGFFLNDELIGRADLTPVDPPRYGLGYWLARGATGKGYARAGLAALLQFACDQLNASEVYAGVTNGNIRSERLLSRLGFLQVADFATYTRFQLTLREEEDHTVFSQPPSTK